MATYTSNYGWTKPSGSDNVDISVLNNNLDDQDSTIHDAFLNMAPPFSESSTYAVDDIVLYGTGLYKCHTAVVTPGSWTGSTNWQVHKLSEGGGGTTDYDELENHPSINNVELSGNKTGAQLGLQNVLTFDNVPTENSTNPVKSGGVYAADEAIRQWTTAEAKSVSGNPIIITDGSARKAEGLSVECNPKQNLHGYEKPWAGGAGKNKLSNDLDAIKARNTVGTWVDNVYSYNGINYTYNDDGTINIDGTVTGGVSTFCLPTNLAAGNYLANGMVLLGANTYMQYQEGSYWSGTIQGAGDLPITSNGDSGTLYIYVRVNVSNATVKPMLRLASVSDATFAPYTNICPITGYTACVVDRNGKNKLDVSDCIGTQDGKTFALSADLGITVSGSASGTVYRPANASVELTPSTNYVVNGMSADIKLRFRLYDSNNTMTRELYATNVDLSFTTTVDEVKADVYIVVVNNANGTVHPMMRFASVSDATFAPYSHYNVIIAFGQTVYGAIVNLKTRKATLTHAVADLGALIWTYQSRQDRFIVNVPTMKRIAQWSAIHLICSVYGSGIPISPNDYVINTNDANLYVRDTSYNGDTSAFATAMAGQTICYELATPIELTLTPAELELLKGYNYITTNGTTIALDYLPDSLLAEAENYVDAKIPPAPSSDGTYVLTCTVTDGTPAYSWESAT